MTMEINIKEMTEVAYATLQKSYEEVYQNIIDHPSDGTWLADFLGFEPYETKKYVIDDFELKDSEKYSEVTLKNGIILYEHLNILPRYILCNSRFWAWLEFDKCYRQAVHSVNIKNANIIKEWWLGSNSRRSLSLGVLSREYFVTEMTVDPSNETDNYIFTKTLVEGKFAKKAYRALTYRNIGMLKNVNYAFIKAIEYLDGKSSDTFTTPDLMSVIKDTSKIGSVMLIDDMSSEEIYAILKRKIDKRMQTD